jgi:hypothetical protein
MKTNQLKQRVLFCVIGIAVMLAGCAGLSATDVNGSASVSKVQQTAEVDISSKASQ